MRVTFRKLTCVEGSNLVVLICLTQTMTTFVRKGNQFKFGSVRKWRLENSSCLKDAAAICNRIRSENGDENWSMFEIDGISDHKMIHPKDDHIMETKVFKCISKQEPNHVLHIEPTTNGEDMNWFRARHKVHDIFDDVVIEFESGKLSEDEFMDIAITKYFDHAHEFETFGAFGNGYSIKTIDGEGAAGYDITKVIGNSGVVKYLKDEYKVHFPGTMAQSIITSRYAYDNIYIIMHRK